MPLLRAGASIVFLLVSAAALVAYCGYQFVAIRYRYPLDFGEGVIVDQAMLMASGRNIYPPDISTPPWSISNYPPLYVAALAISVKLVGPAWTFTVGRLISALATLVAGLSLARLVWRGTSDRFAGIVAVAMFTAFPFVVAWAPLVRIDMTALALSLGGLYLLVAWPPSQRRLVASALLMVAAIYARQSYGLAAPLAGVVWLGTHAAGGWRLALRFAAQMGAVAAAVFVVLNWLTGGGFYFHIVAANINDFDVARLDYFWQLLRRVALVPLVLAVATMVLTRGRPLFPLVASYLVGSAVSALTVGKVGSNFNYLLELCAGLSLCAALLVAWVRRPGRRRVLQPALLLVLAFSVVQMVQVTVRDYGGFLRDRVAQGPALDQLAALIAATPDPVLVDEYQGILAMQGRPLVLQPFAMTQLAREGRWDQRPLLERIESKHFTAIVMFDRWSEERWTDEMLAAIDRAYVVSETVAGNRIYRPAPLPSGGLSR